MAPGDGHDRPLEAALFEAHHLANLTGMDLARLARRRLVSAQSAEGRAGTRDHLQDAIEYLELARLERRDTAAGFARARSLATEADAALGAERPPVRHSLDRLLEPAPPAGPAVDLVARRREAAVTSFEQLRHDVALEEAFSELRDLAGADASPVQSDPNGGGAGTDGDGRPRPEVDAGTATDAGEVPDAGEVADASEGPDAAEELSAERALQLAGVEVAIARREGGPDRRRDAGFEFVSPESLVAARE